MARVLLAWELGGNSGHVIRLAAIAERLLAAGHEPAFALQRPDALRSARALGDSCALRQAPVWPGQLLANGLGPAPAPATYGDMLANFGMADSGVLEYLLRAWEQLLADARPDVVIADFAPAALMAACGRVPTVAVGTGYTVPPAHLAHFPVFHPERTRPNIEEPALLRVVNHALARLGREPLERLPQIARADRECPAVFVELDPYAQARTAAPLPPFLSARPGFAAGGSALAAYLPAADLGAEAPRVCAALARVARQGVAVLLHAPGLAPAHAGLLADAGVQLFQRPLPTGRIVAEARLILGTGGAGLTSTALVAGIPLALIPAGIEQRLNALALCRIGTGCVVAGQDGSAPGAAPDAAGTALAAALMAAWSDPALAARARAAAPGFAARLGDPAATLGETVAALVGA